MRNKARLFFLKKIAAVFVAAALLVPASACQKNKDFFEKQDFLMDTVLTQRIYGAVDAQTVSQKVADFAKEWEKKFSAFDEKSELFKINKSSGKPVSASEETVVFLNTYLEYSKKDADDGFDISVLPLSSLWKTAIDKQKLPSESQIKSAAALVDDSKIAVDIENSTVTVPQGMGLDLGALAKGASLEKIYDIYEQNGVTGAVCSLGSSALLLYGNKPDTRDFKIGLRDPFGKPSNLGVLSLSSCVVSTSGGYERFAEIDGKEYHHIIDPKTGYPVKSDIASVTVIGKDGALCDYLSTKLFLEGFEKAVKTAQTENISAVLVSNDKKVFVSKDMSEKFELIGTEYERIRIE